jgi:hypothetical protein
VKRSTSRNPRAPRELAAAELAAARGGALDLAIHLTLESGGKIDTPPPPPPPKSK